MGAHLLFIGGEDHNLRIPFLTALASRGYNVTTAASADPAPFERAGIRYIPIRLQSVLGSTLRFARLAPDRANLGRRGCRYCPFVRYEAEHSHSIRIVLQSSHHNCANDQWTRLDLFLEIVWRGRVARAAYRPLQRLAGVATAATVFEHRGDQGFFESNRLIGRGESVKIPGAGIDVKGFEEARMNGPSAEALRAELGLTATDVVITVTRVTREKGVLDLLKAAELVHRVRPSVRFLIVGPRQGEGPFAVSDAELAPYSEYVIATGSRRDVPSLLAMSDVFAFPSDYGEGVPRAVMEAALCGMPIVTTDKPGCMEVIRDGWNGYVTPARNPRAMADRILDLLNDRALGERMGALGPDLIKSTFSLDEIVNQHAALYERLLCKRRLKNGSEGELASRSEESSKPRQPAEIARRQHSEPQDVF